MDEEQRRRLSESLRNALDRTERFGDTLIGRSESEATAAAEAEGITVRIASRDGTHFKLRADLRPSRVNLTIENGVVTAVEAG